MRRAELFCVLVALGAAGAAPAAERGLPPVAGALTGKFRALKFPGAPAMTWRAEIRPGTGGGREGEVAIDGEGTKLRVRMEMESVDAARWEITEGELDAAAWFPAIAPMFGAKVEGVSAQGRVSIGGRGEWTAAGVTGVVSVAWHDGELRNAAAGWSLTGFAFAGDFQVDSAHGVVQSRGPAELTLRTITTGRFGARNLFVRAELDAERRLAVSDAHIEIAGGNVAFDPFTMALSPPRLGVNLRIARVGLQDVAALVPDGFSSTHGRVSGEVGMHWSQAEGFELGAGWLKLDPDEAAGVRLVASPGLLTGQVPEHIDLLPAWTGPLAKWLRPKDPVYPELEAIELGKKELRVDSLEVQLTPGGDARGRTASVHIVAKPGIEGTTVKQVTFDVNVAGPLSAVLKLGLNRGFSVGTR